MPNLSLYDILGLVVVWGGLAGFAFIITEPIIQLIGLASAYYLSKWIILKRSDPDPEPG